MCENKCFSSCKKKCNSCVKPQNYNGCHCNNNRDMMNIFVCGHSNGYSNGYIYCDKNRYMENRCIEDSCSCRDNYKWQPKKICCEEKKCWNDCKPKKCCKKKVKSCSSSSSSSSSCSSSSSSSSSSDSYISRSCCTSKPKIVNGKKKWCCKKCKNKYNKKH